VEEVTVELLGNSAQLVEPHLIRNAALAVLHYFKAELGRTTVSIEEFSKALEVALRGLGLKVNTAHAPAAPLRVVEADLNRLIRRADQGLELAFFPMLREELRHQLAKEPEVLRFRGLRGCVKRLVGSKRWSQRCQRLNDQIVEYLRKCFDAERAPTEPALLVLS
jgi:hypothetical protein